MSRAWCAPRGCAILGRWVYAVADDCATTTDGRWVPYGVARRLRWSGRRAAEAAPRGQGTEERCPYERARTTDGR